VKEVGEGVHRGTGIPRTRVPGRWAITGALLLIAGCETVFVNVVPPASVEVSPSEVAMAEGESLLLSARVLGGRGEVLPDRPVTWSSRDPAVAGVTTTGRLEGLRAGSTVVRAESGRVGAGVPVSVLPGPSVLLSDTTLELRAISGSAEVEVVEVQVRNAGAGVLSGLTAMVSLEGDPAPAWMEASLSGTTAPAILTLAVRGTELLPGTFSGQVLVDSPSSRAGPAVIVVSLLVQDPPPALRFNPGSVAFSAVAGSQEAASQQVGVENSGGGVLDGLTVGIRYLEGQPTGWLSAELEGSEAPTALLLQASPRLLAPGSYGARVQVGSPVLSVDGRVELEVVFTVSEPQR